MYIYPDNLKSRATLWLWQLKDLGITGVCAVALTDKEELTCISDKIQNAGILKTDRQKRINCRQHGKRERKRRQETDTRHLIGVQALTEYGLVISSRLRTTGFCSSSILLRKNSLFSSKLSLLFKHNISTSATPFSTVINAYIRLPMLASDSTDKFAGFIRKYTSVSCLCVSDDPF